jgi:hypothetical protein
LPGLKKNLKRKKRTVVGQSLQKSGGSKLWRTKYGSFKSGAEAKNEEKHKNKIKMIQHFIDLWMNY